MPWIEDLLQAIIKWFQTPFKSWKLLYKDLQYYRVVKLKSTYKLLLNDSRHHLSPGNFLIRIYNIKYHELKSTYKLLLNDSRNHLSTGNFLIRIYTIKYHELKITYKLLLNDFRHHLNPGNFLIRIYNIIGW